MSKVKTIKEIFWEDIGYYCEAILLDGGGAVHFTIYEAWKNDKIYGDKNKPWFDSKLDMYGSTQNPMETNSCFEAYIKFDGCMSVDLGSNHFCGKKELSNFTTMLNRLYEVAEELLPFKEYYK